MRKKNIIVYSILFVFAIIGILYYVNIRTLPLIPNNKSLNQFYLNDKLINEKTTVDNLQQILLKYKTKVRLFYNPFPLDESTYDIRIDYYLDSEPRHIMIGKDIFVYSGTDNYFYCIVNEEDFKKDIIDMHKDFQK